MKSNCLRRMVGYSLLEVAIVLLITGVLMTSMLKPFGAQMVERQRAETQAMLFRIRDAVIGFTVANSHLPCAITDSSQPDGDCSIGHGYVPGARLGISGHYNEQGFLTDAWGSPFLYSVSITDADADGFADFTHVHGMQLAGIQTLSPDLEVCNSAVACNNIRANQLPVIIVSTGARADTRSADELENTDGDNRFVARDIDEVGDDQFDDLVVWVSENILYTHLIQARVLP